MFPHALPLYAPPFTPASFVFPTYWMKSSVLVVVSDTAGTGVPLNDARNLPRVIVTVIIVKAAPVV